MRKETATIIVIDDGPVVPLHICGILPGPGNMPENQGQE